MAEPMNAGPDLTHALPAELLQHVFWFSKQLEPPVFRGTTPDFQHEFKSPWFWPINLDVDTSEAPVYAPRRERLGWIRLSHVNRRWREVCGYLQQSVRN